MGTCSPTLLCKWRDNEAKGPVRHCTELENGTALEDIAKREAAIVDGREDDFVPG